MEERMASVISAFVDNNIDFSIIQNKIVRVSLGDRNPWVIDIDDRRMVMRLAVSVPAMRYPAVRKACRKIESTSGLTCGIYNGDVLLADKLPDDLPDYALGPFCLLDVEIFRKTLDYAVPVLIYALESNWRDWAFFAHARHYYRDEITIRITDWEGSELYRKMKHRRFLNELMALGTIDLSHHEMPALGAGKQRDSSPQNRDPFVPVSSEAVSCLHTDSAKDQIAGAKKVRTVFIGFICLFSVSFLALLQVQWALSSYGGSHQFFMGVRREFLLYACMAFWFGVFVPPTIHGKRPFAAGFITCLAAVLYTGVVLMLNNAWHFLDRLQDLILYRDHGYLDSLFTAFRDLLERDIRYHAGLAEFRYPLVFVLIIVVLLLGYYIRYRTKSKLRSLLSGCGRDRSVFRINNKL